MISIVPYDKNWPLVYQKEAHRLQEVLKDHLAAIHHIGSTAIPEMPAKPVIDMLLEFNSLDEKATLEKELSSLGYEALRRNVLPHLSFFTRRDSGEISFHLHIYIVGDPQIRRHLNFRDYVIHHPKEAHAYAELKKQLASQHRHDRFKYVVGKDKLVQKIDAKAKLWKSRNKNFIEPRPLSGDASHEKIVKAVEANLNVNITHFAQYIDQIELIRVPGSTIVNTGLPDKSFNDVLDAHFVADAAEKISEISDYFKRARVPFSWWVCPNDRPPDLTDYLAGGGYKNVANYQAMYLNLDRWEAANKPLPELTILRARDKKSLHDFAMIDFEDKASWEKYYEWIADVITEEDPIEFYVGYVNDKPVVRGQICFYAGVAGFYSLATVRDERHKGYATAMQHFRIKRARELGYHLSVLIASQEAIPLDRLIGYKDCGKILEFCI